MLFRSRLRSRAGRLIKQLDADTGYRAKIEHDLQKRLGDAGEVKSAAGHAARKCGACATANDADAVFCKSCGGRLA